MSVSLPVTRHPVYFCTTLTKPVTLSTNFTEVPSIKFHGYSSSGSRDLYMRTDGRTSGHVEANRHSSQLQKCASTVTRVLWNPQIRDCVRICPLLTAEFDCIHFLLWLILIGYIIIIILKYYIILLSYYRIIIVILSYYYYEYYSIIIILLLLLLLLLLSSSSNCRHSPRSQYPLQQQQQQQHTKPAQYV